MPHASIHPKINYLNHIVTHCYTTKKNFEAEVKLSANLERNCVEEPGIRGGGGGLKETIFVPITPFGNVKVCSIGRFGFNNAFLNEHQASKQMAF